MVEAMMSENNPIISRAETIEYDLKRIRFNNGGTRLNIPPAQREAEERLSTLVANTRQLIKDANESETTESQNIKLRELVDQVIKKVKEYQLVGRPSIANQLKRDLIVPTFVTTPEDTAFIPTRNTTPTPNTRITTEQNNQLWEVITDMNNIIRTGSRSIYGDCGSIKVTTENGTVTIEINGNNKTTKHTLSKDLVDKISNVNIRNESFEALKKIIDNDSLNGKEIRLVTDGEDYFCRSNIWARNNNLGENLFTVRGSRNFTTSPQGVYESHVYVGIKKPEDPAAKERKHPPKEGEIVLKVSYRYNPNNNYENIQTYNLFSVHELTTDEINGIANRNTDLHKYITDNNSKGLFRSQGLNPGNDQNMLGGYRLNILK